MPAFLAHAQRDQEYLSPDPTKRLLWSVQKIYLNDDPRLVRNLGKKMEIILRKNFFDRFHDCLYGFCDPFVSRNIETGIIALGVDSPVEAAIYLAQNFVELKSDGPLSMSLSADLTKL